jgi:hypothetical protein
MSTLPSIFAQKMAIAANSPCKKSGPQNFKASIVNSRKAGKQHPATKWLTATGARKTKSILSGSTAALLTIAKPNKINPISLISPSKTFDDRFNAHHGHHDLGGHGHLCQMLNHHKEGHLYSRQNYSL